MEIYSRLNFPPAPAERPFVAINMVVTIDGKILSGTRDEHVLDLGSKNDHVLMKRIEGQFDAVIVGGQTLRASPETWNPTPPTRIVVSRSGNVPWTARFLAGDHAFIATSQDAEFDVEGEVKVLRSGKSGVDLKRLCRQLRTEMAIRRLLLLGGSDLNAQFLSADLVDELFVTIAPKVKLGRDVPTYADGQPLSRENLQRYKLIEHHAIGDEIFIRYRRSNETA